MAIVMAYQNNVGGSQYIQLTLWRQYQCNVSLAVISKRNNLSAMTSQWLAYVAYQRNNVSANNVNGVNVNGSYQ